MSLLKIYEFEAETKLVSNMNKWGGGRGKGGPTLTDGKLRGGWRNESKINYAIDGRSLSVFH